MVYSREYLTRNHRNFRVRWSDDQGWTLQESLAPRKLEFYDRHGSRIGNRREPLDAISEATGIATNHILHSGRGASVATKMSWTSGRRICITEDRAYSLMGVFDVNMPLLYGEGPKAFERLQLEIIRGTDDETVFFWHNRERLESELDHVGIEGMLASSTKDFAPYHNIRRRDFFDRKAYAMTNKGLEINVPGWIYVEGIQK